MARVTVGLPVYNAETHLAEAIECILCQTFSDLEILISDNASSDDTEAICRRYVNLDKRIRYVRQKQNLGATENYNYVCRNSESEFFKWQSSNDYCTEDTIESCVTVLDENPDVVLCYPPTKLFERSLDDATDYDDNMVLNGGSSVERFFHVIDKMKLNNIMNGVIRTRALHRTPLVREFYHADRNMVAELALMGLIVPSVGSTFYRRMDAESATQLKSEGEVLAHFDPKLKRPLTFTYWRIFLAHLSSLMRCDIGLKARLIALPKLGRRLWWDRRILVADIVTAMRYAVNDLSVMILRSKKREP